MRQSRFVFWFLLLIFASTCIHVTAQEDDTLRVHYHRYDNNYDGWNLWTWNSKTSSHGKAVQPLVKQDEYGLVFILGKKEYGNAEALGLLPRLRNWELKDDPDRIWKPEMGNEVWILQGESDLFTTPPNTDPPILAAFVDSLRHIRVTVPVTIRFDPDNPPTVSLQDEQGQAIPITNIRNAYESDSTRTLIVEVERDLHAHLPVDQYEIKMEGFKPAPLSLRLVMDHPSYISDANLGYNYTPEGTVFRLFAPSATKVDLLIYAEPEGGVPQRYSLDKQSHGIWETRVNADLLHTYYTYTVDGNDELFHPENELIDPYSLCNTAHDGRGMIIDDRTPVADRPMFPPQDAVIYEVHVRDFSIDFDSGIDQKGTYLGMTEQGTTYKDRGEVATGLDHMLEMGINTIQLLPIQDFDNNEASEEYNWGYMPVHFNSPDGWYATERLNAKRVEEFKKLVDTMHKHGIRVIMDVVYNHTAESNKLRQFSFNGIVPNYYYRLTDAGTMWNGSGTGNEFRSEAPMARKFILDSVKYWVNEYKVDGFRFDLMGLIDLETMVQITEQLHEIDPNILVYGEPWAAGGTPIEVTEKGSQRGRGFGVFNDHFRNALKSSPFGIEATFLVDGERIPEVKEGIRGSIYDFAHSPLEVINYVECHDNHTFWDQLHVLTQHRPDLKVTEDDLIRMNKLGTAIIFTSQGMPFIQMGQEMLRTKYMVENSYNAPDSINQIEWDRKIKYADVVEYYQGLIQMRKDHPMFRLTTREAIEENLAFFDDDLGLDVPHKCIAFELTHDDDPWGTAIVLLNPNPVDVTFPLPGGEWTMVVNDQQAGIEPLASGISGEAKVAPRSAMVLHIVE